MVGLVVVVTMVGLAGLYVRQTKGLPKRSHFASYERAAQQLVIPPNKDDAAIAYVGKEKAEFWDYSRYSGTHYEKTVAVVGDSHARSAYFGIAKLGREMGFNTVMLGNSMGGRTMSFFNQGKEQPFMDILLKKPDIRLVFLVYRIRLYISGEPNYTGDLHPKDIEYVRKLKVPADMLRRGLQDMVDKLKAAGKEVIIVGG